MASLLSNVTDSLVSTLSGQFETERDALSLTDTLPKSYTAIIPGLRRPRHAALPAVLVIPFPAGEAAQMIHEGTGPTGEWRVPYAIEVLIRETTGKETTGLDAIENYACIVDRVLMKNQRLGRSDNTLVIGPGSFVGIIDEQASPAIIGVSLRTVVEVYPSY